MSNSIIDYFKKHRASGLISRSTLGLILINFIVQRIFRVSGRFPHQIHFTNCVVSPKKVEIFGQGSNAEKCLALNGSIYIQGSNGVRIHASTLVASGVKMVSGNHDIDDFSKESVHAPPIVIEKGCWLGTNVVILPKVVLHENTIVGAGSVVVKGFGKGNIVVGGNPARILRERK